MNKWKIAFFALLAVVLLVIVTVSVLLFSGGEKVPKPAAQQAEGSIVTVETSVEEFETIAKQYVSPSLKKSPVPVDFSVTDVIRLYSTFSIFGIEVPITMDFEPFVEEDGNITLDQTAVNVGKLNIPPSTILKLLNDTVDFPDFITVSPKTEQIFVDLSRINIANGSRVRAQTIDLKNDHIELQIVVPNE